MKISHLVTMVTVLLLGVFVSPALADISHGGGGGGGGCDIGGADLPSLISAVGVVASGYGALRLSRRIRKG